MPRITKKQRAEKRALRRESIKTSYIVSFVQYGEMVDHEFFSTKEEMLQQIAYYNDVFSTVGVMGIRYQGRTLSQAAVNELLKQLPT